MPTLAPQDYSIEQAQVNDPGRHFTRANASIHIKATARETNHLHSLIELTIPAYFPGVPLHYHKTFVESFYVIEGQFEITRADETLTAAPGRLVHIPMGVVHGFTNPTDQPARLLVICTPGGHDAFSTDLIAWLQCEREWPPTSRETLVAFGRNHDIHFV